MRAGLSSEIEILTKRGHDPIEFITKRAEFLKQRKEIAEAYDLDAVELGTTLMPGDVIGEANPVKIEEAAADSEDSET